ncbi:unnamed protein product, partial [Laminaria digitata]
IRRPVLELVERAAALMHRGDHVGQALVVRQPQADLPPVQKGRRLPVPHGIGEDDLA